jgi:hypothetical protein
MEHKVKTIEVLERHKIHPKAKAHVNIPLWYMISMPIVRLTLKVDVLKMEQAFQMGCQEGAKMFCLSHELERGGGICCRSHPRVGCSLEGCECII